MSVVAFDTLDFATRLREAGFSEEQARVVVDLQKSVVDVTLEQAKQEYHLDDLATKRDLKEMELKFAADLKGVEARIAETKAELIRWVVGAGLLQTALITGVLLRVAHLI